MGPTVKRAPSKISEMPKDLQPVSTSSLLFNYNNKILYLNSLYILYLAHEHDQEPSRSRWWRCGLVTGKSLSKT